MYISKRSGMDHIVLPANTPCLPFLRMRSPDGATSNGGKRHLIAAYYSSINPERMKGWVGLVGCPIADGLPHKWSSVSYRSSAGQRKYAGWRPTFYHWDTQPIRGQMLSIGGEGSSNNTSLKKIRYPNYTKLTSFSLPTNFPRFLATGLSKSTSLQNSSLKESWCIGLESICVKHWPNKSIINNYVNKAIVDVKPRPCCTIPSPPLQLTGYIACAQKFSEYYLHLPVILNDPDCCMTLLTTEWSLLQRHCSGRSVRCSEDCQCFWIIIIIIIRFV